MYLEAYLCLFINTSPEAVWRGLEEGWKWSGGGWKGVGSGLEGVRKGLEGVIMRLWPNG